MSSDYRLVLAQRGTSGLGSVILDDVLTLGHPRQDEVAGRWTKTLNAAGVLEFTLPIDAAGVTEANFMPGRELHLYRTPDQGAESLRWAGHLWTVDVRLPWVRFLGMGWYETFRHRQMGDDFYETSIEQQDAAWNLIDYSQSLTNGNIGVTRAGASGATKNRVVTLCAEERTVIADAIEDLAGADDGFDFDITPDKVWRSWAPARGTDRRATVTLSAATNLTDLSYTIDGTQIENEVAGIGNVADCEPIHYTIASDSGSQSTYGVMQGTLSRPELKQDGDLIDALARERLKLLKVPRRQPSLRLVVDATPSPLSGEFDVGDIVTVTAAWGYATFSAPYRVLGYSVGFDTMGNEAVSIDVDAAI